MKVVFGLPSRQLPRQEKANSLLSSDGGHLKHAPAGQVQDDVGCQSCLPALSELANDGPECDTLASPT